MGRYKVLIVEDDKSIRRVWETVFSQRGWRVDSAGTVAEGLALLDEEPDYLILDMTFPIGNGLSILRKVRESNLKTRVAVTTGDDDSARLRLVRDLQPEAIFHKPIDIAGVFWEGELAKAG